MKEQKSNPMVILAVLGVVSGIVPFVSAAKIISGMIAGNREWSFYIPYVIAAFAGFALKSLFYAMGLSVSHRATFSLLAEIRKQIFAKLPKMPLGTIIDTSSGTLKQIIVDEVERMERPVAHMIPELTSNIIGALAVWVYLMVIDWRMGLICLISVPVGLAFFGFIAATYAADYKKSVEITQDMNAGIVEYVHGIEVIKAYSQGRSSFRKFRDNEKNGSIPGPVLDHRAVHAADGAARRLGDVYRRQHFGGCLHDVHHAVHVHRRADPDRDPVYGFLRQGGDHRGHGGPAAGRGGAGAFGNAGDVRDA